MASEELMSCRDKRWSLKGMTALVTGGTRGIGYAIVEELAGFGAVVHTCSRNQKEIDERLKEWAGKGYKVSGSTCDLSSRAQQEELMKTVCSVFDGKLNILTMLFELYVPAEEPIIKQISIVNNAASTLLKHATENTAENFSSLMALNVESPFHLSQLAHPLLKASGNGSIVFISSVAGGTALPAISVYAAGKGAINQLTKNLACEWAKDNIRTNTVAPWATKTTITSPEVVESSIVDAYAELMLRTPLRRMAEPEEVSSLVAFLCLPAASYITGQIIYTDGGYTAGSF